MWPTNMAAKDLTTQMLSSVKSDIGKIIKFYQTALESNPLYLSYKFYTV